MGKLLGPTSAGNLPKTKRKSKIFVLPINHCGIEHENVDITDMPTRAYEPRMVKMEPALLS
jgi:hypothetical protein